MAISTLDPQIGVPSQISSNFMNVCSALLHWLANAQQLERCAVHATRLSMMSDTELAGRGISRDNATRSVFGMLDRPH